MRKTLATLLATAAAAFALSACSVPAADQTVLIRSTANFVDGFSVSADMPKPFTESSVSELYCSTVTYQNNSTDDVSFNPYDWTLRDTKGVVVSHWTMAESQFLGSGNLVPGGEVSGDVCFSRDDVDKPAAVIYDGAAQITFAIR